MTTLQAGSSTASPREARVEGSPNALFRRCALGLYALAIPLAFPHAWPFEGTSMAPAAGAIDLGLVFAWLVPAALVVGIDGRSAAEARRDAFLASLAGHAALFHWFHVVTVTYGHMPPWLGVLSPLVPALYVSLFSALFAWGFVGLRARGSIAIVAGAALWVSLDWARAHFLGGFPWATLGYALHQDWPLLGWTRFGGVYVLSFAAAAIGIAGARALTRKDRTARRDLIAAVLILSLAHGLGAVLPSSDPTSARSVRIAAVQGNIDQGQKWSQARRNLILEKYLALSAEASVRNAEWIVWPETALPGIVELDRALAERIVGFARAEDTVLVVGGMGIAPDESGGRIGAFYDSAFLFDAQGALLDRYDKTQLVPFGEFVPLRALFGRFFEALATGLSSTDVTAGARPRVLAWDDPLGDGSRLRVATPICYELLFPHLMRRFGEDGADLMLAMTNDAWYGRTGAPHQFLAMTAMRAAENGRWIVRAANTGISAIIDDRGRVLERSALFEDAVIVADVPAEAEADRTFYARHGDVFAAVCAFGAWGRIAWMRRRARAAGVAAGDTTERTPDTGEVREA